MTITASTSPSVRAPVAAAPPQLGRRAVLAVWAAAAVPMGLLSWVVAPVVASRLDGPAPLARALIACLTAGLAWQALLVAGLVARERRAGLVAPGAAGLRRALWLTAPTDDSGRRRRRAWWWLVPLLAGSALVQLVPSPPVAAGRDFGALLAGADGRAVFSGSWGWFAVVVAMALLNTVLGEELLFRGYLLPRMRNAFGRNDWLANGLLFAAYHVHVPWAMPGALFDAVLLALPTRRLRSAWFGIAVHSAQSVVIVGATLAVVLGPR